MSMTSIFVNILIFVRNKYHPLGMQRVSTFLVKDCKFSWGVGGGGRVTDYRVSDSSSVFRNTSIVSNRKKQRNSVPALASVHTTCTKMTTVIIASAVENTSVYSVSAQILLWEFSVFDEIKFRIICYSPYVINLWLIKKTQNAHLARLKGKYNL